MKRLFASLLLMLLLLPSPVIADTVETYSAANQKPIGAQDYQIDLGASGFFSTEAASSADEAEANCSATLQAAIDRSVAIQTQSIQSDGYTVLRVEQLFLNSSITLTQVPGGWSAHCVWSCSHRFHFSMLDGSGAAGL